MPRMHSCTFLPFFVFYLVGRAISKEERFAFIAPVHTPKFNYAVRFYDSYQFYNMSAAFADIFFVVSTDQDRAGLSSLLDKSEHARTQQPFSSTVHVVRYRGSEEHLRLSPIFSKKWWMVNELLNDYEYMAITDCEVAFVSHVTNMVVIAKEIMNRKLVFGVGSKDYLLTKICFDTMRRFWAHPDGSDAWEKTADVNKLLEMTKTNGNGYLYIWWNEIPIVESRTARPYIKDYHVLERSASVFDFDHMSYVYYLLLKDDWNAMNMESMEGGIAGRSISETDGGSALSLSIMRPHWVTHGNWMNHRSKFANLTIILTYHHDRV